MIVLSYLQMSCFCCFGNDNFIAQEEPVLPVWTSIENSTFDKVITDTLYFEFPHEAKKHVSSHLLWLLP